MSRLLVFARAPRAGRVKTRLIPALGGEGAMRLHTELVRHTLFQAAAAGPAELQLWVAGNDEDGCLAAMARRCGAVMHRQQGADLGARMHTALRAATETGETAVIVGTDCPWLDADALIAAMESLNAHDAVLGPAADGGYVLLGLHRAPRTLFRDIEWGTPSVLDATRERLQALEWSWHELACRYDVDRPEDLERLCALGPDWRAIVDGPRDA